MVLILSVKLDKKVISREIMGLAFSDKDMETLLGRIKLYKGKVKNLPMAEKGLKIMLLSSDSILKLLLAPCKVDEGENSPVPGVGMHSCTSLSLLKW